MNFDQSYWLRLPRTEYSAGGVQCSCCSWSGIAFEGKLYSTDTWNLYCSLFYKKINFNSSLKREVDEERFKTPEVSHRYEQLVYRALSQELISSSKAASLLNMNINEVLGNSTMLSS